MKKLYELLQLPNKKRQTGLFGIEIEVEGKNLKVPDVDVWNTVNDGSLRGQFPYECAEWVLAKPLSYESAVAALTNLRAFVNIAKSTLEFSFRTSVHVHVNVQDLTLTQYQNFLYLALLFENMFVKYCGKEREGNRFCLRTQDAEGIVDVVREVFTEGAPAILSIPDEMRYSSINLAATKEYGSVEFRAMKGNLDVEYISKWLKALGSIKTMAMSFDNPQHIHDAFVRSTPKRFAQLILADVGKDFWYDEATDDMRMAYSLTLDIPHSYVSEEELLLRQRAAYEKAKLEVVMKFNKYRAGIARDMQRYAEDAQHMLKKHNNNVAVQFRIPEFLELIIHEEGL